MTEPTPEPLAETAQTTIENNPQVVQAITDHLGGAADITTEQVSLVLGAWNAIRTGAAPGTIVKDPATGTIAHRVNSDGVHLWRVSAPDGSQWSDLSATLPGWEVLVEGTGS